MRNLLNKILNFLHLLQSVCANIYYAFPQRKLKLIGVTGTDGKTTTTQMIYHILKENGFKVGYISTISAKIGEREIDTGFHVTTPDPWSVPKYLKMMSDQGIEYVVLESTSHGLVQNRLWGIEFNSATITNIKSDHLDYHKTWENYAKAKALLIDKVKDGGAVVLNEDDKESAKFLKEYLKDVEEEEIKQIWYSKSQLEEVKSSFEGFEFEFEGQRFFLPIIGRYNLENALAAINICKKYLPLTLISKALANFPSPIGRMEVIQTKPFVVIIDFAHTPHALEAALNSLRDIQKTGRIISVFGCAGKRDRKRREMGRYAITLGEMLILTAEDPRDEKLKDVNDEIIKYAESANGVLLQRFASSKELSGLNFDEVDGKIENLFKALKKPIFAFDEDSIQSRIDAIKFALSIAKDGDIVFITGKAHEKSLAFGKTEYPWYDRDAVLEALKKLQLNNNET